MSSRFTMPNVRWMTDMRANCLTENENKRILNVKDDFQYAKALQENGLSLVNTQQRLKPKIEVKIENQATSV